MSRACEGRSRSWAESLEPQSVIWKWEYYLEPVWGRGETLSTRQALSGRTVRGGEQNGAARKEGCRGSRFTPPLPSPSKQLLPARARTVDKALQGRARNLQYLEPAGRGPRAQQYMAQNSI